ncbi:hypothetical protein GW17_00015843 [Ensete ventricosum]|nr:hypothetical protein GW17_00015843 [Ensete ventricosum]RZR92788.1 hypothetical protein BHM03_00021175 [Ensete ventricosum]
MHLGTYQECVGSSPRVSGVCQDGAKEFAKRRPRLTGRLSGVAEKLVESRNDDGPSSDDAVGSRRKFARRFTEGTGSSLGTQREIAGNKAEGLAARLLEVAGIYGS